MTETNVVPLFRREASEPRPSAVQGIHSVSMSTQREKMRRAQVRADLERLLQDAFKDNPRVELRLELDGDDMLSVVAIIGAGLRQPLTSPYPKSRIDDFGGMVRASVLRWRETVGRRTAMRIVN